MQYYSVPAIGAFKTTDRLLLSPKKLHRSYQNASIVHLRGISIPGAILDTTAAKLVLFTSQFDCFGSWLVPHILPPEIAKMRKELERKLNLLIVTVFHCNGARTFGNCTGVLFSPDKRTQFFSKS